LIDDEFGNEAPLTITMGKVHDYLGRMTLNYSETGKVKIKMLDYVERILAQTFPMKWPVKPRPLQLITYSQ
jgi:hypothetical protein